jgi:hypothetical protein
MYTHGLRQATTSGEPLTSPRERRKGRRGCCAGVGGSRAVRPAGPSPRLLGRRCARQGGDPLASLAPRGPRAARGERRGVWACVRASAEAGHVGGGDGARGAHCDSFRSGRSSTAATPRAGRKASPRCGRNVRSRKRLSDISSSAHCSDASRTDRTRGFSPGPVFRNDPWGRACQGGATRALRDVPRGVRSRS